MGPFLQSKLYQRLGSPKLSLDLKVVATPEGTGIKGYLDPSSIKAGSCLPTTGQTWGEYMEIVSYPSIIHRH